jgi:aspartokinase-like uncharacterized kinase
MKTWQEKAFKLGRFDAVVKVGGSIISGPHAQTVATFFGDPLISSRLLLIPGGGDLDNLIEEKNNQYALSRSVFHRATALAQDQSGLLFTNLHERLYPIETIREAEEVMDANRIPVLLPSRLLFALDVFRYTNRVSTDTISAYLAWLLHVPQIILLKSRKPTILPLTSASLVQDAGFVDEVFPDFIAQSKLKCLFIAPDEYSALKRYLQGDTSAPVTVVQ